ncbi:MULTISPECIES: hypothetical protein [Methylotuvimicrobium]|uniref:Transmembrane protein n=2 Tax=Methylotuvimicrobium TaxID=2822410 RepID=G4T0Y2_META2|nr:MULTISPECIES: hypothetical protein [Methylotuvimicrobium]QCW83204.1 hypothetical protein EQU24_13865 [Methylotuvimicrobium buryatense]CCE23416.1 conserved membrane protein of unknown function [Methylotuvimicrobium alcaliphilum 20Z]
MAKLIKKISNLFLGFWVFIYILLEELIWDTIAIPVFRFVHSLKVLQRIESSVVDLNRYALLCVFLFLFIQVELLGFIAIGLLAKGSLAFGITLYIGKIPIAAFTFWLFRIAKAKLLTFVWFKISYEFLMRIIDSIKASAMHQRIVGQIVNLKQKFEKLLPKNWVQALKKSSLFLSINRFRLAFIRHLKSLR